MRFENFVLLPNFFLGTSSIQCETDKVSDNEKQPKKDSSETKEAVGAEDIFGDDLSIRYGNGIYV